MSQKSSDPPLSSQVDTGMGLCWELLWATAPSVLRAEGHGHPDTSWVRAASLFGMKLSWLRSSFDLQSDPVR